MTIVETLLTFLFFFAVALFCHAIISALGTGKSHWMASNKSTRLTELIDSEDHNKIVSIVIAVVAGVAGMVMHLGWGGVIGLVLAGAAGPRILMQKRQAMKLKMLENQLVTALNMIGNAMRAGRTLPQAVQDASVSLPYPICDELIIFTRQIRVGVETERALAIMAERMPIPDMVLATRAMRVALSTGSNLPEALKRICDTIHSRHRLEGKVKALTAQGKTQGIVIGALPILMLIAFQVMSPDYVGVLFHTKLGNIILATIAILQVIAYIVIQNICRIKI